MSISFYHSLGKLGLANKTIVVPIVSTANIGQLAADLLIASLALQRIGVVDARDVVPVVGARDDGEPGITTPLEVYGKEGVSLVVLQQRSPVLKSRKEEFSTALLSFLSSSGFASVLFLAGIDSTNRSDDQMLAPIYHLLPPSGPPLKNTPLSALLQLPIPPFTPSVLSGLPPRSSNTESEVPFVPGGGLTRRLLSSLPSPFAPAATLLQFVMEGDNREDAKLLATAVARILGDDVLTKLPKDGWQEPSSWKTGLFGTGADSTLYG